MAENIQTQINNIIGLPQCCVTDMEAVLADYKNQLNKYDSTKDKVAEDTGATMLAWRIKRQQEALDCLILGRYSRIGDIGTRNFIRNGKETTTSATAVREQTFRRFQKEKVEALKKLKGATPEETAKINQEISDLSAAKSFVDYAKKKGWYHPTEIATSAAGSVSTMYAKTKEYQYTDGAWDWQHDILVGFKQELMALRNAQLESSFCAAYLATTYDKNLPEDIAIKNHTRRVEWTEVVMAEFHDEECLGNWTPDYKQVFLKHGLIPQFEGQQKAYDQLTNAILANKQAWQEALAFRMAEEKPSTELREALVKGNWKTALERMNRLPEKSNQPKLDKLTRIGDRGTKTITALNDLTLAEARYYYVRETMNMYRQNQKEMGSNASDNTKKDEIEPKGNLPIKPVIPTKPETGNNTNVEDVDNSDIKTDTEPIDISQLKFDSPEQLIKIIEKRIAEQEKLEKLIESQKLALLDEQTKPSPDRQKINKLNESLMQNYAAYQTLGKTISDLQGKIPQEWEAYKAGKGNGSGKGKGKGLSTLKANAHSVQSGPVSAEEREKIAAQYAAQAQAVNNQGGGFWGFIKKYWMWLVGLGAAIAGFFWYRNNKKKDAKKATTALTSISTTASQTANEVNSAVSNVNKVTSENTSLGTKITAVDNLYDMINATKDNINSK